MPPVTRRKETFVVQKHAHAHAHTHAQTPPLLRADKQNAQRDHVILHLIHMYVSVKVLHFVYLHCVRVVSTAERKGNRNRNGASKDTHTQSEASSPSIHVNRSSWVCVDPLDRCRCQDQRRSAVGGPLMRRPTSCRTATGNFLTWRPILKVSSTLTARLTKSWIMMPQCESPTDLLLHSIHHMSHCF